MYKLQHLDEHMSDRVVSAIIVGSIKDHGASKVGNYL